MNVECLLNCAPYFRDEDAQKVPESRVTPFVLGVMVFSNVGLTFLQWWWCVLIVRMLRRTVEKQNTPRTTAKVGMEKEEDSQAESDGDKPTDEPATKIDAWPEDTEEENP
jgi:hypothetical protein